LKSPIETLNDIRQDLLANIEFYDIALGGNPESYLKLWYSAKKQQATLLLEKHFPEDWQSYMRANGMKLPMIV
jgi:hypothetical protein